MQKLRQYGKIGTPPYETPRMEIVGTVGVAAVVVVPARGGGRVVGIVARPV
jgi:hypothetical protein